MDPAHLVREARLRAGFTQAELAARAGTTQSAVARLESGASSPSFVRVFDLVEACGLSLRVRIVERDGSTDEEQVLAPSGPAQALPTLVDHGVRFVVHGRAAAALRGHLAWGETTMSIVPDDARANLEALGEALGELGARVRVEDGTLPLVRTPASLRSRPSWELVTPGGPLDLVFVPPGTRGYRDLVREASAPAGLELPVASLRDAIRELEAAGADADLVHRLRIALGRGPRRP